MKIIDTNTVNYIFNNNLKIGGLYYLAPDVKEESEIVEQVFGKKLPENIKDITNETVFDECVYVKNYKEILNKYGGRSFYNMTGFGDISILASVKTLKEYFQSQPPKLFGDAEEELIVITEDESLKKKIEKEFNLSETKNSRKIKILNNSSVS